MPATLSLFEQAADKLREAMEGPARGADRMRLIQEALLLYHRQQLEDDLGATFDSFEAPAPCSSAFKGAGVQPR